MTNDMPKIKKSSAGWWCPWAHR